jgi:hypothetical protein
MPAVRKLIDFFAAPILDYAAALEAAFPAFKLSSAIVVIAAAAVTWWVYVPIHELLHAYGCIWSGGGVTRLEIDGAYGAAWLQQFFPFVAVGSEYAGQLTGFDTRGSDLIYLATDFLPFVLTIVIGVPLLQSAIGERRPWRAALKLGVAMPIAFAPFISITGDYYEMGSIIVSRLTSTLAGGFDLQRWRSDDLFKLAGELQAGDGTVADALGLSIAFIAGVLLMFATYAAGRLCSSWLLPRRGITTKDTNGAS